VREASGNIWDWIAKGACIVIPTNIGWRSDGANVMGAGLAAQAKYRYPGIDHWYGLHCRTNSRMYGHCVAQHPQHPLIFFPTKALDPGHPALSWRRSSDLITIVQSLTALKRISGEIALPLVGCGNGGLPLESVLPLLQSRLDDDRFTLVRLPWQR
jgi:hypothetical protein